MLLHDLSDVPLELAKVTAGSTLARLRACTGYCVSLVGVGVLLGFVPVQLVMSLVAFLVSTSGGELHQSQCEAQKVGLTSS